jgi:hypothetical protein
MLAGVVISILITMYLCRYKGMACLRIMHCVRSTKHDDYESPTDREKRMKNRLQKIQYDIYELQNKVTKDKKTSRPRQHSVHDTDSLHEAEYVSMRNLDQRENEIEFNQFPFQSSIPVHTSAPTGPSRQSLSSTRCLTSKELFLFR